MSTQRPEYKIARRLQKECGCKYMTALNAVEARLAALIETESLSRSEALRRARELPAHEFGLATTAPAERYENELANRESKKGVGKSIPVVEPAR